MKGGTVPLLSKLDRIRFLGKGSCFDVGRIRAPSKTRPLQPLPLKQPPLLRGEGGGEVQAFFLVVSNASHKFLRDKV